MKSTNFDGSADFVRDRLTCLIRHGCDMRVVLRNDGGSSAGYIGLRECS